MPDSRPVYSLVTASPAVREVVKAKPVTTRRDVGYPNREDKDSSCREWLPGFSSSRLLARWREHKRFEISFRSYDMRGMRRLLDRVLVVSVLAGCGGSMTTSPGGSPPGNGDGGGTGGGDAASGGAVPNAVTVTVGNNFFGSDRNRSVNAAVDTVAAGGKVTWVWAATGRVPHTVQSTGKPSFTSSAVETEEGSRYELTFTAPGSYRYNCAIHGDLMSGIVVVR
jgi:plastocyanin